MPGWKYLAGLIVGVVLIVGAWAMFTPLYQL